MRLFFAQKKRLRAVIFGLYLHKTNAFIYLRQHQIVAVD